MKKETIVKIDSRNRLTIPKDMTKHLSSLYKISQKDNKIILEPIMEIPREELWLFDPKNKAVLDQLKEAIKQKADRTIDLNRFEKK